MIHIPNFATIVRNGFSKAGESPLASASWEAIRAIFVVTAWTVGLFLVGAVANISFFIMSLPEVIAMARGGSDAIQGGGVLAILLRLLVALSFVFTSPPAMAVSAVYLVGFPVLWTWIGLQHGWSVSLRRWETAVRHQVGQLASRTLPPEALQGLKASARAMGEVLGKMISVREKSGVLVRWLSRGPAKVAVQLRALLHEMPGHEGAEAAERILEDLGKRIRFALPAAILWGAVANLVWFAVVKIFL